MSTRDLEFAESLARLDDVVELRRDLHRHPELGFTEIRTAGRVIAELSRAGWKLRYGRSVGDVAGHPGLPAATLLAEARGRGEALGMPAGLIDDLSGGHTAVVADLSGNRPGPSVALRFDMDALPIVESSSDEHLPAARGYASVHSGVMHACGHDGHVAIGIALARRLADRDFPGHVRLLFQPAEEGVRGAHAMVEAGTVDDVDVFYAVHLGLGLPVNAIAGGTTGRFATRKLFARFHGRASHASGSPEAGRNALLAVATAALNVQALPRFSTADTRVNVGRLAAGTAANIIAADAEMAFEVRSTDTEVVAELTRRAEIVCASAAAMQEVEHGIVETGRASATPCDDALAARVAEVARAMPEVSEVHESWQALGSDDATLFMERVKSSGGTATYMGLGSGDIAPHHSDRFDIDERVLPVSVELLERLIR